MSKTQTQKTQEQSIEKLISDCKEIGLDEVPKSISSSYLESKLIQVMKGSGKIHTSKQMSQKIKNENGETVPTKWFSDKMWDLSHRKDILVHLDKRGFYQYNFNRKTEEKSS